MVLSVVGQALPVLVAVPTVPLLLSALGVERFGILSIIWAVLGYFSVFDLGLGRALTRALSSRDPSTESRDAASLIWSTLAVMSATSVVAAFVIQPLVMIFVVTVVKPPPQLSAETIVAFRLVGAAIPLVVGGAALRGVLEALHRFDLVNLVRAPLAMLTLIGPLAASAITPDLGVMTSVLVVVRGAGWIALLTLCLRAFPGLRTGFQIRPSLVWPLIPTGGWIAVASLVIPFTLLLDRLFIVAFLSASALAYYAGPYEGVTKTWLFSTAVAVVLFPALAGTFDRQRATARSLYVSGLGWLIALLFPITLAVELFAPELLARWLGQDFASISTGVLQWLAMGVFFSSLALVPYTLLQATGRAAVAALVQLAELPVYAILLLAIVQTNGITGVAVVWTVRAFIDAILNGLLAGRWLGVGSARLATALGGCFVLLALMTTPAPLSWRVIVWLVSVATVALVTWFTILTDAQRYSARHTAAELWNRRPNSLPTRKA